MVLNDTPGSFSKTGWTAPENMSAIEWFHVGTAISEFENATPWFWGDWWNAAKDDPDFGAFREKIEAPEWHGPSIASIRNYASIARSFHPSSRREGLSLKHHAEVTSLSEIERNEILEWAVGKNCSVEDLKAERNRRKRSNSDEYVKEKIAQAYGYIDIAEELAIQIIEEKSGRLSPHDDADIGKYRNKLEFDRRHQDIELKKPDTALPVRRTLGRYNSTPPTTEMLDDIEQFKKLNELMTEIAKNFIHSDTNGHFNGVQKRLLCSALKSANKNCTAIVSLTRPHLVSLANSP